MINVLFWGSEQLLTMLQTLATMLHLYLGLDYYQNKEDLEDFSNWDKIKIFEKCLILKM